MAARCDWRIFWSRCSSGSSLRRFWCIVVTSTRTVASLLLISNPRSLGSIVSTNTGEKEYHKDWSPRSLVNNEWYWVTTIELQYIYTSIQELAIFTFSHRSNIPSCGSWERRSSYTFLPSASTASLVGSVLSMTTISATLCPVIMVPFLYDPTWRTSSICCGTRDLWEGLFVEPVIE